MYILGYTLLDFYGRHDRDIDEGIPLEWRDNWAIVGWNCCAQVSLSVFVL